MDELKILAKKANIPLVELTKAYQYSDELSVLCPRCGQKLIVTNQYKLVCRSKICQFSVANNPYYDAWIELVSKRPKCGKK